MKAPLVAHLALAGLLVGAISNPAAAQSAGVHDDHDFTSPRPRLKAQSLGNPFATGGTLRPGGFFTQEEPRKLGVYVDETSNGILVDRVVDDSLASAAGVEAGDILLSIAGQRLDVTGDIARALGTVAAGGTVEIGVVREGVGLMTLEAKLPKPEKKKEKEKEKVEKRQRMAAGGKGFLGVEIGQGGDDGVEISGVLEGTAAWFAGLAEGDVLVAIDGKGVTSGEEIVESIGSREAGAMVNLAYVRDGKRHESTVRLGRRQSGPLGFAAPFGEGTNVLPYMNQLQEGAAFAIPQLRQLPGQMNRYFGNLDEDQARLFFAPGGDDHQGLFFHLPQMLDGHGIDLGEILDDLDVDVDLSDLEDGGSFRIEIEDGKMTIDRDGDVEVYELDSDELQDISLQWHSQSSGGMPSYRLRGNRPFQGVWNMFQGSDDGRVHSYSLRRGRSECEASKKECEEKKASKSTRLDPDAI